MTMPNDTAANPAVSDNRGLCWGIKSTFTTYVESMSDGNVAVSDGAERMADGAFFFPLVDEYEVDGAQVNEFGGCVQFTGHHGMLVVTLTGLQLVTEGEHASLTIEDALSPTGRLTLVEMSGRHSEGDAERYASPKLTEDGADLFFDNYPVGTEFEPIWPLARS